MNNTITLNDYINIHCNESMNRSVSAELEDYTVIAADGHFVDHACHTPKGTKGKVSAVGFIYAMNLRNGLLRPLSIITNETKRDHEILVVT
jgi:hypothetical protein